MVTAIIIKINLAEGLSCRAATRQIGRVGGATRLFQSVVKTLDGFWTAARRTPIAVWAPD